jgi:hypothetical protein
VKFVGLDQVFGLSEFGHPRRQQPERAIRHVATTPRCSISVSSAVRWLRFFCVSTAGIRGDLPILPPLIISSFVSGTQPGHQLPPLSIPY